MFEDRRQAARMLEERLGKYRGTTPLVLAVPRGGIILAEDIVKELGGEMDLIIPRKIGAPNDPEFAIGAVGPDRSYIVDKETVKKMGIDKDYVAAMARVEAAEITRRNIKYRGTNELPDVRGRTVIVVDDGIATGYTMKVVLKFLKKARAKKIIVAVPVAPPESLSDLRKYADEIICLEQPRDFGAIGEHYRKFPQVSDDEVIKIMRRARE